ncbi:YsnF/AvaK domain-containing protein [Microvirga sp. TS319]|uniref:YsnF/AvaK domain-containing protein n=1 Tax=Microvirga sp. TS319 TaxID=3241165 RepID=UPI00351A5B04
MTSSLSSGSSSTRRMVTAFFDSRSDAEQAIERLTAAGVSRDSIRFMPGDERDPVDNDAGSSARTESRGFWDSLGDWFLPDEDRGTFAEGLRRGGYLLSVEASDAQYERVLDILDDEGTIDIDERADTWRSEGWTGTSGSSTSDVLSGSTANLTTGDAATASGIASGTADRSTAAGATRFSDDLAATDAGSATAVPPMSPESRMTDFDADGSTRSDRTVDVPSPGGAGPTGAQGRLSDRDEEVIPVAEERLRVGKRDVSHGRVRVRSYVVETPVEEQVTLREERVAVERHPADRALSDADQAFQERTIEAEERGEEAVVSKEARVTEEVVVRKEAEQRTEAVSDTVRKTEVEVEDERGTKIRGTGTTDRT